MAGFIPVVGDFANAINAGISLSQGHYGEAAIFAFSAVPVLGWAGEVGQAAEIVEEVEQGVQLSQKGLDLVGNHLAQFGDDAANAGMMQRLQGAFAAGQDVTGADANFYLHEASESTFMKKGLSYDAAHAAALQKYGV